MRENRNTFLPEKKWKTIFRNDGKFFMKLLLKMDKLLFLFLGGGYFFIVISQKEENHACAGG